MDEGPVREGPLHTGLCQLEWLHYQVHGRELFEHQDILIEVPNAVKDRDVQDTVDLIVSRHESLRSTFSKGADQNPVQRVWRPRSVPVERRAARDVRELDSVIAMNKRGGFRVESEFPVRATLVEVASSTRRLHVVLAHIASDLGSTSIVEAELVEALLSRSQVREPRLPPPEAQPVDLALHQASDRGRRDRALSYWSSELSRVPTGLFPERSTTEKGYVQAEMGSRALGPALAHLSRTYSTEASVIVATAFAYGISLVTGQPIVPYDFTWANRTSHRTRDIVAAVFRDMMLRVDLSGEPSFSEAVNRTRGVFYRGARHMDFDMLEFREEQVRSMVRRGSLYRNDCVLNFALTEEHLLAAGEAHTVSDEKWESLLSRTTLKTEVLEESVYFALTNLWTGLYPDGDRVFIFASAKQRFLDTEQVETLLRSLEKVLVEAARDGDIGFERVEQLVGGWHRPWSGRWSFSDGTWVRHETIEDILSAHPSVLSVEVYSDPGDDRITAHVTTDGPELDSAGLRDFFLEKVRDHHSAVSPHRFVIATVTPAISGMAASDWWEEPVPQTKKRDGLTDTASQRALQTAVTRAHDGAETNLDENYVVGGGRFVRIPLVLETLAQNGYAGLDVADFERPCTLRGLARRLRKVGSDAHESGNRLEPFNGTS